MKAEAVWPAGCVPIGACGLQQRIGAVDIGFDECTGGVDGPVHMAFRGKMHHGIGTLRAEDTRDSGLVANVGLVKPVARVGCNACHVVKAGGIGELVDVDHVMPLRNRQAHYGRANETCAAGHQNFHVAASYVNGLRNAAKLWALASLSDKMAPRVSPPQSMPRSGSSNRTAPSASAA